MQIHELNNFTGELDSTAFVAVDNGSDTGKVPTTELVADVKSEIEILDSFLNGRIDNIIAGGAAPSESEIIDARYGADGLTYSSLGEAIRAQIDELGELRSNLFHISDQVLNHLQVGTNSDGTIYALMEAGYSTITANTRFDTITLPAGTYTATMEKVSGSGTDVGTYLQAGADVIVRLDSGAPATFTLSAETLIQLSFSKNNSYNYNGLKIAINAGSEALPWTKYGLTAKDDIARNILTNVVDEIESLSEAEANTEANVDYISHKMGMVVGAETTIPSHESGKYVYTATMAIASSVAYDYSDAIPINKGDLIYANLQAASNIVEAIAYCNSELTEFSHGVTGVDPEGDSPSNYWLVSDRDGYVCFSFRNDKDHKYRIISFADGSDTSNSFSKDLLCAFDNITCIGDSLTAGVVYTAAGNNWRYAYNPYPKILQRKTGAACTSLASGGYSASDWWLIFENSIEAKANQLTIVYLGTNDGLTDTMDTDMIGDDYTQWANTDTACYGKIIAKSISVGSRVLLVKIYDSNADVDTTNSVIDKMAARFNVAVVDNEYLDDLKYHSYPDGSGRNTLHYNDFGYAVFAEQLMHNVGLLGDSMAKRLIPQ